MTDATNDFFNELSRRGHEPMLNGLNATVRFDISHDGRTRSWRVDIRNGDISVSPGNGDADCVIAADQTVFDGIASGEVNAMTAMLRGELVVSGDLELVVTVQRLFPAPPRRRDRHLSAVEGGGSA